jgi:hypothetical protein
VSGTRLSLLALLASALLLAACGGEDDDSAEAWAGDVCGALDGWVVDIEETLTSLTEEGLAIDKADLTAAVDDTKQATDELVDELRGIGPPETESGTEAKEQVDELASGLQSQLETVEDAVQADTPVLELVSTVSAALSTAATQLEDTLESLADLDPGGELEDAVRNADECDELRDRVTD